MGGTYLKPEYIYDITQLEKSPHISSEDRELYWLNTEHTKLTDGYSIFTYAPGIGVVEPQVVTIPTTHQRIDFELIKGMVDYLNNNQFCTQEEIFSLLQSQGFSEEWANQWLSIFIDAVAEFTLVENIFDNCKTWVVNQFNDGKTSEQITEMLIGMLAFTDIIKIDIVVYKENMPYKQVCNVGVF